jgi:hypothetical protein
MPYKIFKTRSFENGMATCLKNYPRSVASVASTIDGLSKDPLQGDVYPGFGQVQVRKVRLALNEYGISKRDGLRLICLVDSRKELVVPLVIYRKGSTKSERDVIAAVRRQLKAVAEEISAGMGNVSQAI